MFIKSIKKMSRCGVFFFRTMIFLICISGIGKSYGQSIMVVKGVVKQEQTANPIPYATIYFVDLKQGVSADFQGLFQLKNSKATKCHIRVSSIGYRELDTLVNLQNGVELEFLLKEKQLTLEEVVVIAKASKGMPVSSVIKQRALRHLQPNSFADILELIPGGISSNHGMTSMQLISLRTPLSASRLSNRDNQNNSSLGTAFVIDGVPLSNDAQLQNVTGAPRYTNTSEDYILYRNTTGKGVDMRMISTDDIESVEVVRGIPSVKYGELTSGLINVTRSYRQKPLKIRAKANPTMKLVGVGKGVAIGSHTLNANFDYIDYIRDPRDVRVNYNRLTASLRYANCERKNKMPLFVTASLDYTGSFDKIKRDEETETKEEFYKSSFNKLRMSSNIIWQKKTGFFDELSLLVSGSYTNNNKIINRIVSQERSPILSENKSGEFYGQFLPVSYHANLEIDGQPLFLFSQLNSQFHWDIGAVRSKLFVGGEWRYNKNLGEGEIYDINRPLYAGNGHPRRSKDIPAMEQISLYAEDKFTMPIGECKLNTQFGIRGTSLLNMQEEYKNLQNTFYWDPRANIALDLPQFLIKDNRIKLSFHTGIGWHTKMPTLSHLYPNNIYIGWVQLNYYSINEALRQMQYKMQVLNPTNYALKPNRNKKWEVGVRMQAGKIDLEVNFYSEKMSEGFRKMNQYQVMDYKKYNTSSIKDPKSLTAPPTVDMFEYKQMQKFVLYSQLVNGAIEEKKGVEYSLDFGYVDAIKSSVSLNGAWMQMKYGQSLPRYRTASISIGGESYPYIGYYDWDNSKEYQQFNTNLRFDTKIESLGLIFSSTLQSMWFTQWNYTPNNGVPSCYFDKAGKRYVYKKEDKTDAVLKYLSTPRQKQHFQKEREAMAIDYNLKLTKKIGKYINLGFYVNRLFHYYPDYTRNDGFRVHRDSFPYFGMELNIYL